MNGPPMYDLSIRLDDRPGALAEMGEALGQAGISIEGGGAFVVNDQGIAHFLFEDGDAARKALVIAGIDVLAFHPVLVQRLAQNEPGQLGRITRLMADAKVNIEVMYTDHNNQLIIVVDDADAGAKVSEAWTAGKR